MEEGAGNVFPIPSPRIPPPFTHEAKTSQNFLNIVQNSRISCLNVQDSAMAGPQPQRNNATKGKVCLLTVLFLYFFLSLYISLLPAYFVLAIVEMVISKISTEKREYGEDN